MMSLSKEELVLAACLLETTDASLSAEDAMSDVKQIMMNLPESLDPAYSRKGRVYSAFVKQVFAGSGNS